MYKMVDSNLIWSLFSAIYGNTLYLTELCSTLDKFKTICIHCIQVYLGRAPCHITLRKLYAKNQSFHKLVVLCPFFVNIPIIKNRVAKWKIRLKIRKYLPFSKNYISFGLWLPDCLKAMFDNSNISDQIHLLRGRP